MENREEIVCKICLKERFRYTCPRCNIQYCSVDCYKSEKHLQCSENFYKDCFIEGLKDLSTSKEERQKILEMLKRVEDETPGIDSDDDDDLEDRLEGLDLDKDTQTVWNRLTDKEKKDFERLATGGELSTLMEIWTPWWKQKNLITETSEEKQSNKTRIPEIKKNIADISTLLKGKPSADIRNNVINVLYSYCFVCRLYNGDHMSLPVEAAKEVEGISKVLSDNTVCGSPAEAVQLCLQCLQNRSQETMTSRQFNISVIEDVTSIIQGPSQYNPLQYVMAAMSDICRLFLTAIDVLSKDIKKCKDEKVKAEWKTLKKKLFVSSKKLEFLLSWAHRYGMALQSAVAELQLEFCALSSDLAEVNETKQKVEEYQKEKEKREKQKLIQEI